MAEIIAFPLPSGPNFTIPDVGELNWGQAVTDFLVAIPLGVPPTAGTFTLTGDLSFGSSFGLVTKYFKSISPDIATTGSFRLSHSDSIAFRNFDNDGDLLLAVDASDNITFNGSTFGIGGAVNPGTANTLGYYATSSDAISSLPLITASRALVSNASGLPVASTVTSTTLAFMDATSSVQTQINAVVTTANAALPKAGGSMTGAIDMGSNKITGLANGTAATDAAAFGQITALLPAGSVIDFAGTSAPSGWLNCDGSAISRTTFATLFAIIGTTWGAGNGTTTFNIPNLSRSVTVGSGGSSSGILGNTVGSTGGTETVSHTHTENSHTHTISHVHDTALGLIVNTGAIDEQSGFGVSARNHIFGQFATAATPAQSINYFRTSDSLTANSGAQSDTGMSTASPSVIQPSAVMLKIIKT